MSLQVKRLTLIEAFDEIMKASENLTCGLINKLTNSNTSKNSSLRRYFIPSRLHPICPVTYSDKSSNERHAVDQLRPGMVKIWSYLACYSSLLLSWRWFYSLLSYERLQDTSIRVLRITEILKVFQTVIVIGQKSNIN